MTRRTPDQYKWATCDFDERILPASPVRIHAPRRQPIKGVTIHHMAMVGKGDGKAIDAARNAWKTRPASAHYVVDGPFIGQCVWDSNEAWACADSANSNGGNQTTLSIEHANSTAGPTWKVSEETWKTGARLVAAIHVFHKLGRPVKGVTRNHKKISGTVFRHHDWYSTECCGPYMDKIFDQYVAEAQRQYDFMTGTKPVPPVDPPTQKTYKVVRGDTLSAIARKFGVTVDDLVEWNHLPNPNAIEVGQILVVSDKGAAGEMKVIIDDTRIKESSTLAYSKKYPDIVYTLNDENGPIYMVNITTGKVVGDFKLKGVTLIDPEALDVGSDGFVTLGDIGDNDLTRKEIAIYVFPEPKLAKGQTIVANKYRLAYKDGKKRNAESLIVNPITNDKFVITKASPKSEIWQIPNKPSETSVSKLTLVKTGLPELVSDASFSRTGSHVVLRQKGKYDIVYVLKSSTWTAASPASFKVSRVDQPESIAVNWDNDKFSYGSEGAKSPLYTVTFPVAYR